LTTPIRGFTRTFQSFEWGDSKDLTTETPVENSARILLTFSLLATNYSLLIHSWIIHDYRKINHKFKVEQSIYLSYFEKYNDGVYWQTMTFSLPTLGAYTQASSLECLIDNETLCLLQSVCRRPFRTKPNTSQVLASWSQFHQLKENYQYVCHRGPPNAKSSCQLVHLTLGHRKNFVSNLCIYVFSGENVEPPKGSKAIHPSSRFATLCTQTCIPKYVA